MFLFAGWLPNLVAKELDHMLLKVSFSLCNTIGHLVVIFQNHFKTLQHSLTLKLLGLRQTRLGEAVMKA